MDIIIKVPSDSKLAKIADKILKLAREYRVEYIKEYKGHGAVIWFKDTITHETFMHTRGEYSSDLIEFINNLSVGGG